MVKLGESIHFTASELISVVGVLLNVLMLNKNGDFICLLYYH
jgi:hypothetical protein